MSNCTSPHQRQQDEVILLALVSINCRYLATTTATSVPDEIHLQMPYILFGLLQLSRLD